MRPEASNIYKAVIKLKLTVQLKQQSERYSEREREEAWDRSQSCQKRRKQIQNGEKERILSSFSTYGQMGPDNSLLV